MRPEIKLYTRRNRNFACALRWLQGKKPKLFTAAKEIRLVSARTRLLGCPTVKGVYTLLERAISVKAKRESAAWFVRVLAHELKHSLQYDTLGKRYWQNWKRHERAARDFAAKIERSFLRERSQR